jgi:signal transduction histidine kinase/ActR/RegA family two-component response regulator
MTKTPASGDRLVQGELPYRALFESMDEAYCVLEMLYDARGTPCDYLFIEVNTAFVKMTGWPHAVGTRMRELAPNHEEHWFQIYGAVARTGQSIRFVQQANILDGRWFDLFAFRLGDPTENRVAVLFTDITESRADREALAMARAELRQIIDLAPSFMTVFRGPEFTIEVANDAFHRLAGGRSVVGRPLRTAFPEVEGQGFFELVEQVYASGEPWVGHNVPISLRKEVDGPLDTRYLDLVYQPLRAAGGAINGVFAHGVDITDRKHAEDELRRSDQSKTDFLAVLAHELRNPLAPIRSAVQLLKLSDGKHEDAKMLFSMMDRQVSQMVRMIDDLLDVSRISKGKIHLRMERIELAAVLQQATEAAQPLCDRMHQELVVTAPTRTILIEADAARLSQAIGNLLSNASKFSHPGQQVRLSVETQSSEVVVRVSDDGLGIEPEYLPQIFDMFAQLDTSIRHSQGGLGIGLSLVKDIIHLHGGSVEAASRGPGTGSEFVIRLPLGAQSDKMADPAPGPGSETTVRPMRILLVDDNIDAVNLLAMLLKDSGHSVAIAYDGLEAVEAASASRFDLILLDIGLPKLDGYEVARRVRARCEKEVFLVAITGWGQDDDLRAATDAGFDAHLTKPVDYREVTELLTRLLASRNEAGRKG